MGRPWRGGGRAAAAVGVLVALASPGQAAVLVTLDDPAGDDTGPGTYRYPAGDWIVPGLLDLRRVTFEADGDDVVIRVALGHTIPVVRGHRVAEDERRDVFGVQVDLYLDVVPGRGHREALPGRRVALPAGSAWDVAVVLTPLPERVRSALGRDPALARDVLVPDHVRVRGRELVARVRAYQLGGWPAPSWGYAACTSAPAFRTTIAPWLDPDARSARNLYTREVTPKPGTCGRWVEAVDGFPCTFGGCDPCAGHPRVLDVLAPPEVDQAALLARYDARAGLLATLPMVWPAGRPAAARQTAPGIAVVDRRGPWLTVRTTEPPPAIGTLADVLDAAGRRIGAAVVTETAAGGVVVLRALGGRPAPPEAARVQWAQ